jgi:hypothetical protein
MASSFWDDDAEPQAKKSFWDDDAAPPEEQKVEAKTEEPVEYEKPGLGRRLYEQNVVIPVRAMRHLAPYPETLQEYVIDPVAAAIGGETTEEHKKKRQEYDRYLRETYPTASSAYEDRAQIAGGLIKSALPVIGTTEMITEQIATRPDSIGVNPETGLNILPGILSAPRAAAKGVGFIKSRSDQRQSLRSYGDNPSYYDAYERKTGGTPVKNLEQEVQTNLLRKEAERADNISNLTSEVADLKYEDARQVARAIDDIKTKTELGTHDGDAMISARNKLQEEYKKTAEIRNKVLEETQGEMNIEPLLNLVDKAERNVLLPEHKAAIRAVGDDIEAMSQFRGQGDNTFQSISPRQLNELRAKLQNNVSWGGHTQPWEGQYKDLARKFNDILDASIPGNNPLRAKIREETIRYNTADDLFGGEYPLKKFQAAARDPMMRRDLVNLGIPEIDDILKTIDYRDNFQKNLKLGEKPKSDVIEEYLRKKAALEAAKSQKMPLTALQAPSAIESAMMETYRNPKLNATNKMNQYAQEIHPEGPMDFMQKLENTKVLRDVEGINGAQGSRMTNLGKYVGGGAGALVGAALKSPIYSSMGSIGGAALGATVDNYASNIFRGGMRYGEKMAPAMNTAKLGSRISGYERNQPNIPMEGEQSTAQGQIPLDRLAGTKYEGQMIEAMNQGKDKAALLHYMLSKRDPEYNALTSGEGKKKEQIPTPRYKGLGADLGGVIDSMSFTDSVGLDPQERGQPGFEYGDQVPQPGSIKPFSFKRLFPKISAEGSQIKQLPKMEGFGTRIKGMGFKSYRDLNVGGDTKRYWEGDYHPSEKIAGKKFDQAYGTQHPDRDSYMHHTEGAVIPAEKGGIQFGMSRGVGAVPHEHVHAQLNNLRTIHPDAEKAMDFHLRQKLKSYGGNPERIDMHSKNPVEFMTSIRDALDESATRSQLMMETDDKFAKRWPQYVTGNREYMQKLRRFWNDAASEAENMTQEDLMRIVDNYKKETIKDVITKKNGPSFSKYRQQHSAPAGGKDGSSPLWDLKDTYPEDIYSTKAKQFYGHGEDYDQESINKIWSLKGNPDAEVEVFRAVPLDVKEGINKGDWVSPSLKYAQMHGENRFDGKYRIIKIKAKAKDLYTDGNSIHEWGFDPQD